MSSSGFIKKRTLYLASKQQSIPDVLKLKKIGAGHDGFVFQDGKYAYKVFKKDLDERIKNNIMPFAKAQEFKDMGFNRLIAPVDFLFDDDGVYSGFVTLYHENLNDRVLAGDKFKLIGTYTCEDLLSVLYQLRGDMAKLASHRYLPKDVNRGSYIFSDDFLYICDLDKFYQQNRGAIPRNNYQSLNNILARLIYYDRDEVHQFSKDDRVIINKWVKKCTNDLSFTDSVLTDISGLPSSTQIGEYNEEVIQKVLHR